MHYISLISLPYRFFPSLTSRDIDFLPWVSEKALLPRHPYLARKKHYSHFPCSHADVTPAALGSGLNFVGSYGKPLKESDLRTLISEAIKALMGICFIYHFVLDGALRFFIILSKLGWAQMGNRTPS